MFRTEQGSWGLNASLIDFQPGLLFLSLLYPTSRGTLHLWSVLCCKRSYFPIFHHCWCGIQLSWMCYSSCEFIFCFLASMILLLSSPLPVPVFVCLLLYKSCYCLSYRQSLRREQNKFMWLLWLSFLILKCRWWYLYYRVDVRIKWVNQCKLLRKVPGLWCYTVVSYYHAGFSSPYSSRTLTVFLILLLICCVYPSGCL